MRQRTGQQMGLKSLAMPLACVLVLGAAVSGCNRSINSIAPASSAPQRLPAAPVESVQADQLPPPVDQPVTEGQQAPVIPQLADGQTQVASTDTAPAPSGEPVSRESVSGAWIVGSDNPDCRMILAFTKWSGGYRAATKRCSSPEVASVSVWDVQGQQVVLMDANGNTIARLYNSGGERFDGTTNSGQPITFTR